MVTERSFRTSSHWLKDAKGKSSLMQGSLSGFTTTTNGRTGILHAVGRISISGRGFRQFVGCTWQIVICSKEQNALLVIDRLVRGTSSAGAIPPTPLRRGILFPFKTNRFQPKGSRSHDQSSAYIGDVSEHVGVKSLEPSSGLHVVRP